MLVYPTSILGYFIVGVAGACTFIFLLVLFDKDISMLENPVIEKLSLMAVIYVVLGGVLSVVVNLPSSPDFGTGQLTLAFSAGIGWPALATGISAGKTVGDVKDKAKRRVTAAEQIEEFKLNEREKYFTDKIAEFDAAFKKTQEIFDAEIERVKNYYLGELSAKGR